MDNTLTHVAATLLSMSVSSSFHVRHKARKASSPWPSVPPGLIGSTQRAVGSPGPADETFWANVRHHHSTHDRSHLENRITHPKQGYSWTKAEARLARYPVNGQVTVHDNPNSPNPAS
ncbi:hypothetical protein HNQ59_003348 [Chitinivorax tropicus]|uniref:Uncharacterized protein n=1 Tax=Chitinivorax tropicus TaxID=714531 RepID=A0A840MNM8_9PROT|nr:hypothetical protein [Chitinivorax tropicus]MBB5020040.1 hypothetical protein [Chitinivorax tropicus]